MEHPFPFSAFLKERWSAISVEITEPLSVLRVPEMIPGPNLNRFKPIEEIFIPCHFYRPGEMRRELLREPTIASYPTLVFPGEALIVEIVVDTAVYGVPAPLNGPEHSLRKKRASFLHAKIRQGESLIPISIDGIERKP